MGLIKMGWLKENWFVLIAVIFTIGAVIYIAIDWTIMERFCEESLNDGDADFVEEFSYKGNKYVRCCFHYLDFDGGSLEEECKLIKK